MKTKLALLSLTIVFLVSASPQDTPNVSSNSLDQLPATLRTCYSEAGPECSFKVTVKGPQISNPK